MNDLILYTSIFALTVKIMFRFNGVLATVQPEKMVKLPKIYKGGISFPAEGCFTNINGVLYIEWVGGGN